ncbi:hypothetical protein IT41_18260 [Paracoccus halophilus]|nr:hypothetical protein IT41_18260 [Paracoccus halophilus]
MLGALGLAGAAAMMNGRMTMAQETNSVEPLARSKGRLSEGGLELPDFPGLQFRTALPEGLEWFDSAETIGDFDASGMFTEFRRLWLGYAPEDRDRLQVSVHAARIPAERVALASDYARLLARVWGPKNYGIYGDERDFGEVMTGEDESGFDRRTRISVWRRGTDLLILRADTTLEDFETQASALAAMVGSLEFREGIADPIIDGLVAHQIRLPSGAVLDYPLPPHWQAFDQGKAQAAPISAAVWLDRADEGGNSAIGIFGVAVPAGARAADAPLDQIAATMSDLMMENLLPGTEFKRQPVTNYRMKGFRPDTVQAMFLDRLELADRKMGASGFFLVAGDDVAGFSSLTAYPVDAEAMGIMMHANFIDRLVLDALREQVGQSAN